MDSEGNEKPVSPSNSLPSLKQGEGKEVENTKGMSAGASKGDSRQFPRKKGHPASGPEKEH